MCQSIKKREKKTTLKIFTLKISLITKPFGKLWNHYYFLSKCRLPETLVKENYVIPDNGKIAGVFNDFFTNAVKNLNITVSGDIPYEANNIKDPVLKAIEKYKKHPSIKAIVYKID